jgi:hypothetical protein
MVEHIKSMEDIRNAYKILVENLKGRYGPRWVDNIKTELKETGCEYVNRPHVAQVKYQWRDLVNTVMKRRWVP